MPELKSFRKKQQANAALAQQTPFEAVELTPKLATPQNEEDIQEKRIRKAEQESPKPSISAMDQVEVLLHEYDTLRDELVENVARQQTFLVVQMTLIVAFIGFAIQTSFSGLFLLLPIAIIVILSLEAGRQYSMFAKGTQVNILEEQINQIAGEPLLTWQHKTSIYHFSRLRQGYPTKKGYIVNTNILVTAINPLLLTLGFLFGLYKGSEYIAAAISLPPFGRALLTFLFVFVNVLLLGLILFSRLVQERKLLEMYAQYIRRAKQVPDESA